MIAAHALRPALAQWVESTVGGRIAHVRAHAGGASRSAFAIDLEGADGKPSALFLLADKGGGGGSQRDAEVLRALAPTAVPVPRVIGASRELGCLLLEHVEGRSDFPNVDCEDEREPTARHLMELAAVLHRLDPEALGIAHLALPKDAHEHGDRQLAPIEAAVAHLAERADPLFAFALGWLRRNAPAAPPRWSLVHSDLGPGNFLFAGGRVRAIVDWEVAHVGDAMEDLAALAVRDMATPVGSLAARYAEYEAAGGAPVDVARIGYYRVLVLVRNSAMIELGLAHPPRGFDTREMRMYATLLERAAALSLCDELGVPRPGEASEIVDGDELGDVSELDERAAAHLFARRWLAIGEERRELLGALAARLPQPLPPRDRGALTRQEFER